MTRLFSAERSALSMASAFGLFWRFSFDTLPLSQRCGFFLLLFLLCLPSFLLLLGTVTIWKPRSLAPWCVTPEPPTPRGAVGLRRSGAALIPSFGLLWATKAAHLKPLRKLARKQAFHTGSPVQALPLMAWDASTLCSFPADLPFLFSSSLLSFPVMSSPSLSLSTLSPSSSASSSPVSQIPFFSCNAADLLQALKACEAFRKASRFGLYGDRVFLFSNGEGLSLQAGRGKEAFYAWLPGSFRGKAFSFPFASFLAFVKSTKGKGSVHYDATAFAPGKLFASSGPSLSLEAGSSMEDVGDPITTWEEALSLPAFASAEASSFKGFPLLPFLSCARFCAKEEHKQALTGVGFSSGAFSATDGHTLLQASADLPGFPHTLGGFPESAWLPAWLASCVEASTPKKERASLFAFLSEEKHELQALRFWSGKIMLSFRFEKLSAFPNVGQLFKDLPFSFSVDREKLLSETESLLQALKASDGKPHLSLSMDGAVDGLSLSCELFRNVGTKKSPSLEAMGSQEASLKASFQAFPCDLSLEDGFSDMSESKQEAAMENHKKLTRLTVNALFLQKLLKGFSSSSLSFSWCNASSAIRVDAPEGKALLMPVVSLR